MAIYKRIAGKKSVHTLIEIDPAIIKLEVTPEETIDVEDVQAWRDISLELSEGRRFYILLDTTNGYFTVTPEAHQLLTSPEFSEKRVAAALVVRSVAARLTGNFFIKIGGRRNVSRMFSTEADALKWIKDLDGKRMSA